jgi:hypothetical protein
MRCVDYSLGVFLRAIVCLSPRNCVHSLGSRLGSRHTAVTTATRDLELFKRERERERESTRKFKET